MEQLNPPGWIDPDLHRRGRMISVYNRWISILCGCLGVVVFWNLLATRKTQALWIGAAYVVYNLGFFALARYRKKPWSTTAKITQNVVDAVSVGFGAFLTGRLKSPFWLLLYPHVVTVSLRGGLIYAMVMGIVDSAIVVVLALLTPEEPGGVFHALALLWCAFLVGVMAEHLRRVQGGLSRANQDLSEKNEELHATVIAHEFALAEQERALRSLRESEERYRRLLESIQEGVLIIQDGQVVRANKVFADMIGEASPEGLTGTDFLDLVPAEDRAELAGRYRKWEQRAGEAGGLESRVRTRKGNLLLVSLRAGSAEFLGRRSVIATIRDITRERRAEQEVKAQAERLGAINEIANAVNLSLTIEDIFAVAAEETARLIPFDRLTIALVDDTGSGVEVVAVGEGTGRKRASFTGDDIGWALRRPTTWRRGGPEATPPHIEELLAEPGIQSVATVPLLSKSHVIGCLTLGRLRPQSFSTWDLAVVEPVARHIAIALDNARLLEAVRKRNREFESLLEIGQGILQRLELAELLPLVTRSVNLMMNTHHCLVLLREGNELVTGAVEGLEPDFVSAMRGLQVGQSLSGWVALQGRPLAVLDLQGDERLLYQDPIRKFGYCSYLCVPLKRGTEILGTLEVVTKEPRSFTSEDQELMSAFADQAAVAIDNARLIEEARAHLATVTEAKQRLEEVDELRQQYLRNVSHEFRTPLTVIRGYAEYLIEAESPGEKEIRDLMRILMESCDRVIDMVDTLIEVSRVEQGRPDEILKVQDLDLRDVALSGVDALRMAAERKGIAVQVDLPDRPLKIRGDQGLLHQVVRKLLDNAVKYSRNGGRVLVTGRPDGHELHLQIEDTGIGIPAEHLSRIFEKFYVVDGGISRRVGGTGVGLYLVHEIVRLHQGTVEVRSRPGEGSVFSVRLPAPLPGPPS